MMKSKKYFGQNVLPLMCLLFITYACDKTNTVLRYNESKTYSARVEAESGGVLYIFDTLQTDIIITGADQNEITAEAMVELRSGDSEIIKEYFEDIRFALEPYRDGNRMTLEMPSKYVSSGPGTIREVFREKPVAISKAITLRIQVPLKHSLLLNNQLGDVSIENVTGEFDLENRSGEITLYNCGGTLELRNSGAPVDIQAFEGGISVRSSHGAVSVLEIQGDTEIRNSYRPVIAKNIGGNIIIDGNNCSVDIDGVQGNTDIRNSYKSVTLSRTSGSINIRGNNSSINISRIDKLPENAHIELDTAYKPITIDLPAGAQIDLFARTQHGSIRSDLPLNFNDRNEKSARLEVGDGNVKIWIETTADITLREE